MAKDHELEWLIEELSTISHIKRLRIHSRLPVVIPSRITDKLCNILETTRLQVVFVSHINHANEIDQPLIDALARLKKSQVHLLNQGVLLKGVNDSADAQVELNEALFDAGVQPYYLHVLDKVQGAAHFYVSDKKAKRIMAEVMSRVSGYIVPKLTREEAGKTCKTPLDLSLES
jgi:KamA family protein